MYFAVLLAIVAILCLLILYARPSCSGEPFDIAWNTRIAPYNLFKETEARDTRYFSLVPTSQYLNYPLTDNIELIANTGPDVNMSKYAKIYNVKSKNTSLENANNINQTAYLAESECAINPDTYIMPNWQDDKF